MSSSTFRRRLVIAVFLWFTLPVLPVAAQSGDVALTRAIWAAGVQMGAAHAHAYANDRTNLIRWYE